MVACFIYDCRSNLQQTWTSWSFIASTNLLTTLWLIIKEPFSNFKQVPIHQSETVKYFLKNLIKPCAIQSYSYNKKRAIIDSFQGFIQSIAPNTCMSYIGTGINLPLKFLQVFSKEIRSQESNLAFKFKSMNII